MNTDKNKKDNSHDHNGHRKRMYLKILNNDLSTYPEHELFEVLLYYIETRKNTNELAHTMHTYFGSIDKILDYDYKSIQAKFDLTDRAATFFKLISFIANSRDVKKILTDRADDNSIKGASFNYDYVKFLFNNKMSEEFYVICLDGAMKIQQTILIDKGTTDEINVLLCKLNRDVAPISPPYIVLAHNHPKGTLNPSTSDVMATKTIITVFKPFKIEVYDHVIVCNDKYYSFKKNFCVIDEHLLKLPEPEEVVNDEISEINEF